MRPLRPASKTPAAYPRHRRLSLHRAGVAITVLLVATATGCGTTDETRPTADAGYDAADAAPLERVELRAPETGEAYHAYGSYHVVLQVPADQLAAARADEAMILAAAEAVLPTDCEDYDSHEVDDATLADFVDALPASWQLGVDHAAITYVCEMALGGVAPEGDW